MASSSKHNPKSNRPHNGGSQKQQQQKHRQKDDPGPPSSSSYCKCGGGNYLGNIRTISIYECHRALECIKTQTNTLMVFLSQTYYNKLKAFECLTRDKSKKYEVKVLELISIWENCRNIFLDDPCVGTDAFMQNATCESALLLFEPKWEDIYTKTKKNFIFVLSKILVKLQTMKYCQDATKNCQWLMSSINDPWTNFHFQRLLCLDPLEPDEMARYLNFENIKLFALRVRLLCESKCEKEALKLSSLAMQFYNRQTISKFYSGLNDIELIRDIYFACLHRLNKKEELVNQLKKFTPKEDGKNLMDRCTKKIKYFAFKKEAQPRICQHMVYVSEMAACILVAKSLAHTDYLDDFNCLINNWSTLFITLMKSDLKTELNDISLCNVIRYFIKLAPTANHIYILCDILKNKFGSMLPQALYIEMHVKALATNINEKEKYKQLNEKEKALESLKSLVQGYLKLANLLENDLSLCCECVLTAYSLMPSNDLLARIEYLAVQSGKWFPEHPSNVPENSCDKNSKTSRMNPKLDVNSKSKKSEESKSVKCVIKKNNLKLCKKVKKSSITLSQHLHSDLIAVINNPRYEPFKWKLKWPELKSMCKQYLEDLDLVLLRNTQYPKLEFLKFEYDNFHVPKLEYMPDKFDVKQIAYYDTEYLSDTDTESIESNNSSLDFYMNIDVGEPLDIVTRNRRSLQNLKNNYEENDKLAVSSLLMKDKQPDLQSRLSDYKCDDSVESILKKEIKINAKKLSGKHKPLPPNRKVKRKITRRAKNQHKDFNDSWCPKKVNTKKRNKNVLIKEVVEDSKITPKKKVDNTLSSDKNVDGKFKDSQNNNKDIADKHSKKKHLNRMLTDRLPQLNSLDYLVPGNTNHIVNVVQVQTTANSRTNVLQSPQTEPISNRCSTNNDSEKTVGDGNQTNCTRSLNNYVSVCQSIKSQPNVENSHQGECSFTGSMTVSNSAAQHEINQPDMICRDVPIQNVNSETVCWEDLQLHQPNDQSMNISNTVNFSSSPNVIVRTSNVTLPIFSTHTTGQQIHTDTSGKKTIYCIKAGDQYVDLALSTANASLLVNSNNYSINVPVGTTTQTTVGSLYNMSAQPHVSVRTSTSSPMLRNLVNARCHPTTIVSSTGNNTQAYTYVSSSNLNSPGTSKTSEPIVLSSIIANKTTGTSGIMTSTPAPVYGKQTKSNTTVPMIATESERAFNAAISGLQTINPTVSTPNTSVISLMIAGSTANQIFKSNNNSSLYVVAAQNPGIATQRSNFIAQHCDKTQTAQILRLHEEQKKNDNLKLVSQTFTATSEAIQFVTSNTERLLQCIEKNSSPSNLTDLSSNPSEGLSNIIQPGESKKSTTIKRGSLKTYESKTKALKEANISDMFVYEKGTLYAVQDESVGQLNNSKSQTVASTKPSASNKTSQNKRQRETIEKPKISPNASPNVTVTGSMLPRFQQAFGKAKFSHNSVVINDNKFSNNSVVINDKFSHSASIINDDNKFSHSAAVINDNKFSHSADVINDKFSHSAAVINDKFSHSAAVINDNKFSHSAAAINDKFSHNAVVVNDNKFSHSAVVVNDNKFSHSAVVVNDNKFSHNSASVSDNSTLSSTNLQNSLSLSPGLIVNKTPTAIARVYSTSKGVQTNTDSEPSIIRNITPLNSVDNKTQRVSVTTNQNNVFSIGGHNKSNIIMTCKTSLPMKSITQQLSSPSHQLHSGNIIDCINIKKENLITSVAKVITPFATTISNSSAGTSTPNVVYTIPIQTAGDLKTSRSILNSMQGLTHVQRQLKVSPSIIQSVLRKHPNLQQSFIRHGKQSIEVQTTSTGEKIVPMSVSNLLKTAIETSNVENKVAVNSSKSNVTEETMEQVREFESVLEEVRKKSLMNEMCTSGNMLTQINHDLLHSPTGNVDLITTENSQTPMFSLNKNTFSFLNQTIANQTIANQTIVNHNVMIKEENSADTNNCSSDRLQKTTPIIVQSDTPTSSSSSAAVSPSTSSSNSTTPKPVDRPTQCSNPIAPIPKPLPPVAVIKTPNDSPTISTVKIPVLQKPMPKLQEDEQTTQRIYAILDKYAEQLRNSPELKNKPAPRRRTNPPTNPSPNVKRKKPSQLNLKTSSQQTSCSSSGMEMSPTSDMQAIDSEDSSNAVSQFSHIMGSPSGHSDEQTAPTVITEPPTTENNPIVNLSGEASEKQEIKVEGDVKPTPVAQTNQIVVNAGSSGPFLSLSEGSTGNVRLLVASSKTSKMYQLHCPVAVGTHGGPVLFHQITTKDPKSSDVKITAANILGQNLNESSLLSALTNNTLKCGTAATLGNEIFRNTSQSCSSNKSSKAIDIISTPQLVRSELTGDVKKQIKFPVTKKSQGSQSTFDDDIVDAQQDKPKFEPIDGVALQGTQNLVTEKIEIVKNEEVDISNEQKCPIKNSGALTTGNNDQEMFEKDDVRMSSYFSVKTPNACAANIQYHIESTVEVQPNARRSASEKLPTNIVLDNCKTEDKLTRNDKQPIKREDNSLKLEPEMDIIDNSKEELKISQKEEKNVPNIDQINAAAAAEIISTVKKSNDAYKQNKRILPKVEWKKDDENEKCLSSTVFDLLHQSTSTNTKIGSLAFRLKNDASAENWHKCLSKVIPPGTEKMLEGENLKQLQSVFQTAKIKTYKDLKVFMIEQCKKIDNNVASALKEYNLYDDIEDLGVDKPSTSELFPDVAILNDFDKSVSPTHNLLQGSTSKLNESSILQGKRKSVLSHTTITSDNEQPTSSGCKKNKQRVSFLKQALINEMNQDSSDYEHKLLFVNGNNKTGLVVSDQNDLCLESPSNIMIADSETCMSEDSTSTMSSGTPHYNFRRSKRKNVEQDGFIESQVIKRMYRGRVTEDEDEPTAKNEPHKNEQSSKTQSSGQKSTPQKKQNNNRRLSSRLKNSNTTKKKKSPSKSPQREKSPPQKPVTTTRASLRRVSRRTI